MTSLFRRPEILSAVHVHAPVALSGGKTPLHIVARGKGWLRVTSDASSSPRRFCADGFDGVVHVAAHDYSFGGLEGGDLDEWRMIYDINVFGTMQLTQAALPALKANGGSIVMIGSQSTDLPRVMQMAYASSKAALRNIGVNTVVATWMWGPAVQGYVAGVAAQRGVDEQVVIDEIASNMPLREIPEDDDVAEMANFLLSDRARMVTGQAIFVNAGEYIN